MANASKKNAPPSAPSQSPPPDCHFCNGAADLELTLFTTIKATETVDVCLRCAENHRGLAERVSNANRVRLLSHATGQRATGPAHRLQNLIALLKPHQGYKSITSAIRITTGRAYQSTLLCAACQEPITPESPGIARWGKNEQGRFHAVRLFHKECCTDPGGSDKSKSFWKDIEELDEVELELFTVAAAEMITQIKRAWQKMK
jgi:hypothetical protein